VAASALISLGDLIAGIASWHFRFAMIHAMTPVTTWAVVSAPWEYPSQVVTRLFEELLLERFSPEELLIEHVAADLPE
jgi:hypothetical protein